MHKSLFVTISNFVNKDARNWDKYVPCAVMACRATPHCLVKYSPHYLVYGKGLRLPTESDWRPQRWKHVEKKVDYDDQGSSLAMRLYAANKEARQQFKLS
jgi:hypothetical protein